ncbi:hypothetical protein [Deinococcus fonticola]|uniref:hypothetical protein n=1 Tax=Deinococcus fonticola TaxID=2528713 RepID=UPI00107500AC|nr:hypothetical protein [Deinococcus fonticola]
METVVALFPEPRQAQAALQHLQARGFEREHLGFSLSDVVAEEELAQASGISPEAGLPSGSAGVIRGAILGVLAGLALTFPVWLLLLLIPETRVYAHGGVMAMWFGAVTGLMLGGMFGALSGSDHGDYVKLLRSMGIPAAQAEKFYDGLKNGYVMVIARDQDGRRADEALTIMRRNGAVRLEDALGGGRLQSERGTYADVN